MIGHYLYIKKVQEFTTSVPGRKVSSLLKVCRTAAKIRQAERHRRTSGPKRAGKYFRKKSVCFMSLPAGGRHRKMEKQVPEDLTVIHVEFATVFADSKTIPLV